MKREKTTLIKPKKTKEKEPKKTTLIFSLITLILGIILLTSSTKAVIIVCYIIGGIVALFGIYHLFRYYKLKQELKIEDNQKLILGVAFLAIGLVIIILSSVLETCLRFIIGFSLIVNGIKKAIIAINNRDSLILILGLMFIAMGLYTILAENIIFQIVGILLILSSSIDILNLFITKKK